MKDEGKDAEKQYNSQCPLAVILKTFSLSAVIPFYIFWAGFAYSREIIYYSHMPGSSVTEAEAQAGY
jgi:hypothetical protein